MLSISSRRNFSSGRGEIIFLKSIIIFALLAMTACKKNDPDAIAESALSYVASNKPEVAIKILQDGIFEFPDDLMLPITLAHVYAETERWAELEMFIRLSNIPEFSKATYYGRLADYYFSLEDFSKSNQNFQAAAERVARECDSDYIRYMYGSARNYVKMGRMHQVQLIYAELIDLWADEQCDAMLQDKHHVLEDGSRTSKVSANHSLINNMLAIGVTIQNFRESTTAEFDSCIAAANNRYQEMWADACLDEAVRLERRIQLCMENERRWSIERRHGSNAVNAQARRTCELRLGTVDRSAECMLPTQRANRLNGSHYVAVQRCESTRDEALQSLNGE